MQVTVCEIKSVHYMDAFCCEYTLTAMRHHLINYYTICSFITAFKPFLSYGLSSFSSKAPGNCITDTNQVYALWYSHYYANINIGTCTGLIGAWYQGLSSLPWMEQHGR